MSVGRGEGAGWPVRFFFEGRPLGARAGDTVAAALTRNGVRVFGRSSKFHRPRGLRCGNGTCSCCAMRVDGLPGVRTCVTPVREDMVVEREHAWPSADLDLLRAAELGAPLLHAGFYYRRLRRSPRLWALSERLLARAAGQGDLPASDAAARCAEARCETRSDVDVLVVGGGVAGMSAGLAAAATGARTLLVERHAVLGGALAAEAAPRPEASASVGLSGPARGLDVTRVLADRARAQAGLTVACGAEVVAWYEEGTVALVEGADLTLVRPRAVVLASGGHERVPPFVNGDLPGVMSGAAAQRLLHVSGVRPGRTAVVLADGERGHEVAAQLAAAGIHVVCVADRRPRNHVPEAGLRAAKDRGIRVLCDVRIVRAHGLNAVRAVSLGVAAGGAAAERPVRVACDLVCVCLGAAPADELARQALGAGRYAVSGAAGRPGGGDSPAGPGGAALLVAGAAASVWSPAAAIAGGSAAGSAAAAVCAGGAAADRSPRAGSCG